ncbi:hypothetical protein AgCh_003062 [Apium graveolens]
MGSKIFLLLGLSIAFALLISSEVAARDLAETTPETEGANLDDYGQPRPQPYGKPGSCPFYCDGVCCSAAKAQALKAKTQVKP